MKKKKKHKISQERLSRYIMSREQSSVTDRLICLYDMLTESQREEIKQMLIHNSRLTYKKYVI